MTVICGFLDDSALQDENESEFRGRTAALLHPRHHSGASTACGAGCQPATELPPPSNATQWQSPIVGSFVNKDFAPLCSGARREPQHYTYFALTLNYGFNKLLQRQQKRKASKLSLRSEDAPDNALAASYRASTSQPCEGPAAPTPPRDPLAAAWPWAQSASAAPSPVVGGKGQL